MTETKNKTVSPFDVFSRMADADDSALKLAPLKNILKLKKTKAGTEVTIGVQGDVVASIFHGKFVGGLILCDKERFEQVKREMEAAARRNT